MGDIRHWIWLAERKGNRHKLLQQFGSAEAVYHADEAACRGLPKSLQADLQDKSLERAERALEVCARLGARVVTIRDPDYPPQLCNICDPPVVLYVRGNMPDWETRFTAAVIGSRQCSGYARFAAERMSYEMARMGAVVVSGLAAGIDSAAHRGALRAGGDTVAVLGCGLDVVYPKDNKKLYEAVASSGAILTEYAPGTPPRAHNFPARNRIVSGLSRAVLVMEAERASGTMITARLAQEQERDLYVLPGPSGQNEGGRMLQQQGAAVLTGAYDLLRRYAGYAFDFTPVSLPEDLRTYAGERKKTGRAVCETGVLPPPRSPVWRSVPVRETEKQPVLPPADSPVWQVRRERRRGAPVVPPPVLGPKVPVMPPVTRPKVPAAPPVLPPKAPVVPPQSAEPLSGDEALVMEQLARQQLRIDDLAYRTGLPVQRVAAALTFLQIKGLADKRGGVYVKLE